MAEDNTPVYSPIQNSVYTAIEYKAHTNGTAPDQSFANRDQRYYYFTENVLPRGGRVKTREGAELQIGSTVSETYLGGTEWIQISGSAMALACFTAGVRYYDTAANSWVGVMTSAYTAIDSGASVDFVQMRTASSGIRMICVPSNPTSGVAEPIRWWNGATTTTFTVLSTAVQGSTGVVWRSHFLLGDTFDTGDGHVPYRVHWSALGDPTVWSGTASAGSIDLIDGNASKVVRFLPLRKELAVYKEFGVHTMTYKGDPFWFTQSLLSEQINLISRNSVCSVMGGDAHFLFTTDGFLLWDGQSVKGIGKDKVDRSSLEQLDWSRAVYTRCMYFPITKEVWVVYPALPGTAAGPFKVRVYNLEYDSWWQQSQVEPYGGVTLYRTFASAGPMMMAANRNYANGLVVGVYSGSLDRNSTGTISIPCSISPSPVDFGHQAHKRSMKYTVVARGSLYTATATNPTLTMNADTYQWEHELDDSTGSGQTFSYPLSFAQPLPFQWVSGHLSSRYLSLGLRWNSTGASVEFAGVVYYAALRGDHRQVKG